MRSGLAVFVLLRLGGVSFRFQEIRAVRPDVAFLATVVAYDALFTTATFLPGLVAAASASAFATATSSTPPTAAVAATPTMRTRTVVCAFCVSLLELGSASSCVLAGGVPLLAVVTLVTFAVIVVGGGPLTARVVCWVNEGGFVESARGVVGGGGMVVEGREWVRDAGGLRGSGEDGGGRGAEG